MVECMSSVDLHILSTYRKNLLITYTLYYRYVKFTDMEAQEFSKTKLEELTEIFKKEGNQKTHQFQEWWDVFEILSYGRKLNLSELEMHSILSNRFELTRRQ